jgi:hypothetical protein
MHTIAATGPLRMPAGDAADTYSALANPDMYLLLTDHFGWTADQYTEWLVSTTARLLLPDRAPVRGSRRTGRGGT